MARFGSPETLAWLGTHGARADSVELKALLASGADAAAEALTGRCEPNWSERRSYLLDTASLALVRAGVEIRLRRRARGRYDLAVCTRRSGTSPVHLTPRGVRVEFDVVPGALWQDLEDRREVDAAAADRVIAGTASPRALLSAAQRGWACTGGRQSVDDGRLTELRVHGPLVVHRVKVAASGLGLQRADLERFCFPSGRELVELSTHCRPEEVAATAEAFGRLLSERAVAVAPGYLTKTSVWRTEIGSGRGD